MIILNEIYKQKKYINFYHSNSLIGIYIDVYIKILDS